MARSVWTGEPCARPRLGIKTGTFSSTSNSKYRFCSGSRDQLKKHLWETRASLSDYLEIVHWLEDRMSGFFWLFRGFIGRTWISANPSKLGYIHFACNLTCPADWRWNYQEKNALSMSTRMRNKNQTLTCKGNLSFPFHKMEVGEGTPTPPLLWGSNEVRRVYRLQRGHRGMQKEGVTIHQRTVTWSDRTHASWNSPFHLSCLRDSARG